MAWNDNLNEGTPAHEIAASNHRHIRVIAGPGTGKSFAMKRRVARILEADQIRPSRILAVTFTRVAAEDLHRELVSLRVAGADMLQGKTIHSLAMTILMRNHVLTVLGRTPRPLNKFELEPLLADLSNTHGNKHVRKRLIKAYGAAWARLQTQEPGYARSAEDQAFANDLLNWLSFHKAMLMDEIVPHLYQYLSNNPGAQEFNDYEHILIDEYQDLNKAEQEALRLLGTNGSICVIGDDDQSIYSFRYAHPSGIREWATLQPTDEHAINECYRCPITVVNMANSLIERNTERLATEQMAAREAKGPGEVAVRQYRSANEEANAVVTKVSELVRNGISPNEIIILTQRETFATPIFQGLRENEIPVKSYYAESELDTLYAQERFALLKLYLNNEDRVSLRWLLGCGSKDWKKKPYARILRQSRLSGVSPWQILNSLAEGTFKIPYTNSLVERFVEIRDELTALREVSENLGDFINTWLSEAEEAALLSEIVTKCSEGLTTPNELYEKIYELVTHPEVPLEISEVRIMSLHKSKGLSSPYVFIVGCIEGLLPGHPDEQSSPDEQQEKLEEDRRLFYVGITRVKSDPQADRPGYLALTHAQTMNAADAHSSQIDPVRVVRGIAYLQPSRFLGEMTPHIPQSRFNEPL